MFSESSRRVSCVSTDFETEAEIIKWRTASFEPIEKMRHQEDSLRAGAVQVWRLGEHSSSGCAVFLCRAKHSSILEDSSSVEQSSVEQSSGEQSSGEQSAGTVEEVSLSIARFSTSTKVATPFGGRRHLPGWQNSPHVVPLVGEALGKKALPQGDNASQLVCFQVSDFQDFSRHAGQGSTIC